MTDKDLIDSLGGSTKVAELLGLKDKPGGVQRVNNWKTRGIPSDVRLAHLDLFPIATPTHTPQPEAVS